MAELAQELANWLQQHPEPSAPTPIHASPSPGTPEATRLACPGCGVRLRLPEGSWGKRFRCPNCQVRFQVPDLATLSHQPNRGQGQSLIVTPERARGQRYTVSLSDTVTMEFTWIEPGTFLMGSPPEEEKRRNNEFQHRVHLTRGYWLGIHQVTQAQWQAIMGDNPSHFQGADLPVECVSWDDCKAFCEKLKQRTGKDFRLPTEAEWEYACRAGTTTPFYFGETISTDQANYDGNCVYGRGQKGIYREKTTPVGNFPPNAWGLYDMHGNVWEWCEDWYDADYYKEDSKENKRPNYGRSRVLRGGSWFNLPVDCRAAYRNSGEPGFRYYGSGVRVCFRVD